jgi:deazaflavin-dependent oxidoreductase (nitroreductase family)
MATATEAGRGLPQALVTTAIVVWAVVVVAAEMRGSGGVRRAFAGIGRSMTTWLLRSRFGGRLARSTTVITFRGRTSGRLLSTPVEYVRDGSRITILVAAPERKQWWRNVRANGQVRLLIDGGERGGRATVVAPPDATGALARYVAERPRSASAVGAGALAVVVELTDAGD